MLAAEAGGRTGREIEIQLARLAGRQRDRLLSRLDFATAFESDADRVIVQPLARRKHGLIGAGVVAGVVVGFPPRKTWASAGTCTVRLVGSGADFAVVFC